MPRVFTAWRSTLLLSDVLGDGTRAFRCRVLLVLIRLPCGFCEDLLKIERNRRRAVAMTGLSGQHGSMGTNW